jgi:hypothetical protein
MKCKVSRNTSGPEVFRAAEVRSVSGLTGFEIVYRDDNPTVVSLYNPEFMFSSQPREFEVTGFVKVQQKPEDTSCLYELQSYTIRVRQWCSWTNTILLSATRKRNGIRRPKMTVRVIKTEPDESVILRRVCGTCGATLEFVPLDIQSYQHTDMGGGTDAVKYVECPQCKNRVILEA